VKDVIAYYDRQTEDEEAAEYQAAMKVEGQTVMLVPTKLVPEIRRLIARQQGQQGMYTEILVREFPRSKP